MRTRAGLSLVELMVAVAVIGILVALALPRYHAFLAQARRGEAKSNLAHLASLQAVYKIEHFRYYSGSALLAPDGGIGYKNEDGTRGDCGDYADDRDLGLNNHLGFRPQACGQLRYFYQLRPGNVAVAFAYADAEGRYIYPDCHGGGREECDYTRGDAVRMALRDAKPTVCRNITKYCPAGLGAPPPPPPPPTPPPPPPCDPTTQCCDGNTVVANTFSLTCNGWWGTFNDSAPNKGCCRRCGCTPWQPAVSDSRTDPNACEGESRIENVPQTRVCSGPPPCPAATRTVQRTVRGTKVCITPTPTPPTPTPPTPTPTPTPLPPPPDECNTATQCCDGNTEVHNTFGLICNDGWYGTFNASARNKGCCHNSCPCTRGTPTAWKPKASTECDCDKFIQTRTIPYTCRGINPLGGRCEDYQDTETREIYGKKKCPKCLCTCVKGGENCGSWIPATADSYTCQKVDQTRTCTVPYTPHTDNPTTCQEGFSCEDTVNTESKTVCGAKQVTCGDYTWQSTTTECLPNPYNPSECRKTISYHTPVGPCADLAEDEKCSSFTPPKCIKPNKYEDCTCKEPPPDECNPATQCCDGSTEVIQPTDLTCDEWKGTYDPDDTVTYGCCSIATTEPPVQPEVCDENTNSNYCCHGSKVSGQPQSSCDRRPHWDGGQCDCSTPVEPPTPQNNCYDHHTGEIVSSCVDNPYKKWLPYPECRCGDCRTDIPCNTTLNDWDGDDCTCTPKQCNVFQKLQKTLCTDTDEIWHDWSPTAPSCECETVTDPDVLSVVNHCPIPDDTVCTFPAQRNLIAAVPAANLPNLQFETWYNKLKTWYDQRVASIATSPSTGTYACMPGYWDNVPPPPPPAVWGAKAGHKWHADLYDWYANTYRITRLHYDDRHDATHWPPLPDVIKSDSGTLSRRSSLLNICMEVARAILAQTPSP